MKKLLKNLTMKDSFMFGVVMEDEENCRLALERILRIRIKKIRVSKEKSILYHPEYKGVRLDILAEDENNTRYNVEMQRLSKDDLKKRSRYYHSQMDMDMLLNGVDYAELSDAYVIFICDFDPFGLNRYQYTFKNRCEEDSNLYLKDGTATIFLNTKGKNVNEVPSNLVKFLQFVGADEEGCTKDFGDEFVRRLQLSVERIKKSREMEAKYMQLELMLREERRHGRAEGKAEGKAEGIAEAVLYILSDIGDVSESLRDQILQERNLNILNRWLKLASRSESMEQFQKNM